MKKTKSMKHILKEFYVEIGFIEPERDWVAVSSLTGAIRFEKPVRIRVS